MYPGLGFLHDIRMSVKAHKVGLVVVADCFTRQVANFVGVDKCVYPTSRATHRTA